MEIIIQKIKIHRRKILKWIFLLFLVASIFRLSNQNGDDSLSLSNKFVQIISQFISVDESILSTIVRKGAHFTGYFLLGIVVVFLLKEYKFTNQRIMIYALYICFLFACADEIHQLFIPERTGRILDILIDTCGSFFGIFIITFTSRMYQKHKNSKFIK